LGRKEKKREKESGKELRQKAGKKKLVSTRKKKRGSVSCFPEGRKVPRAERRKYECTLNKGLRGEGGIVRRGNILQTQTPQKRLEEKSSGKGEEASAEKGNPVWAGPEGKKVTGPGGGDLQKGLKGLHWAKCVPSETGGAKRGVGGGTSSIRQEPGKKITTRRGESESRGGKRGSSKSWYQSPEKNRQSMIQ